MSPIFTRAAGLAASEISQARSSRGFIQLDEEAI